MKSIRMCFAGSARGLREYKLFCIRIRVFGRIFKQARQVDLQSIHELNLPQLEIKAP